MNARDELNTLAGRAAAAAARLGVPDAAPGGADATLGQVFNQHPPNMPTDTNVFYATRPCAVRPGAAEGAPAVLTVAPGADPVHCYAPAPDAPAAGDVLAALGVPYRWVLLPQGRAAKRGLKLSGCPCAHIPPTLYMEVNNTSLNFGLFQPCTLTFGPTPPEYLPLAVGTSAYLSNESFTDRGSADVFRYWLTCYSGYYSLGRLYARSVMGSPFRDMFRYTWLIGVGPRPELGYVYGNTCTPFMLGHGSVFPGGDGNSVVTIHP